MQFKSALAMMQEDIESVESANLSIDGEEREEMCTRIREFYSLSCRYVPGIPRDIYPFHRHFEKHICVSLCTKDITVFRNACRMRVQNNFSIFNDSVLLLLLQQLRS